MLRFVLLLLLSAPAFAEPPRPTSASLRKAFEANSGHLVSVSNGKKKHGPGVVVSSSGHVVTSTEYVAIDRASLKVDGAEVPVDVVFADAKLKVAVVRPQAGTFSASPVDLKRGFAAGDWLLAISPAKKDGTAEPKVGQVLRADNKSAPFIETDLFLPAGTPLFDPKGKTLVAVLVTNKGRALPLPFIKARLDEAQKLSAAGDAP